MRQVELPGGERIPVLGQGTYRMGEDRADRRREVAALRAGMELGMTVIDTAEMYADGGAERVIAGSSTICSGGAGSASGRSSRTRPSRRVCSRPRTTSP